GVILAADKRVTSGLVIDDTDTRKILDSQTTFTAAIVALLDISLLFVEEASSALLLKGNSDKEPHKDDPTLVRKNRHVKKPSYAAMGSEESFALTVLSNYNATALKLSDNFKLYVGLNMLNELHLGGFDARAFIHKFSRIDDLLARSGFLLLCNIGFCFRYSSTEVDSQREYFRKSEHLTGSKLLRHIREVLRMKMLYEVSCIAVIFQSSEDHLIIACSSTMKAFGNNGVDESESIGPETPAKEVVDKSNGPALIFWLDTQSSEKEVDSGIR
ncbi:polypyrimidine tract-binding protein homolog 3, partial [Tanacetum coccineum]